MGTQYRCQNLQRADLVRPHPSINGIDYLEVLDADAPTGSKRQETLLIRTFKDVSALGTNNVRIEGGVRIRPVKVLWAYPASAFSKPAGDPAGVPDSKVTASERAFFAALPDAANVLVVRTDQVGDFSSYTLRLVALIVSDTPPANFDLQLSNIMFSFKVECPSDFDCQPQVNCPPDQLEEPRIDYLARDFESFRRLMLDRMSVIAPAWRERNVADLEVALVEVLAFAGDRLSYVQDAISSEAYLGTAHHRASVRRHARLLDYPMHDGRNARVWVAFEVDDLADGQVLQGLSSKGPGTRLLTRSSGPTGALTAKQADTAVSAGSLVFETLEDLTLRKAHNEIEFYTWGDLECCLPKGATRATLKNDGGLLQFQVNDVLIFQEVRDGKFGKTVDANPLHRHTVRLTRADPGDDPLVLESGSLTQVQRVFEIEWALEDALTFPLCVGTVIDFETKIPAPISVALGNVALADHGRTVEKQRLPKVENSRRYRPELKDGPVTQHTRFQVQGKQGLQPFDPSAPAARALEGNLRQVQPAVALLEPDRENEPWLPQRDLLASDRFAREFVLEVENDGRSRLRFGDDVLGAKPKENFAPDAQYRVGNGRVGNVGLEAIVNVVTNIQGITKVYNPLPARGGLDPEDLESVRLYAPQAFRRQERAVTATDYAEVTQRHPEVQRAAATIRWTGSWYTVFVTIDRIGGRPVDAVFEQTVREHIEPFRMSGHDLEVNAPVFVPLDLQLEVCVQPGHYRSNVKQALLETFSSVNLSRGGRGFFHPDQFSFGMPVYLSQIYAAAMGVEGVASVTVLRFQRFGKASNNELTRELLQVGRLEIVRLDNDPNFPENGKLELVMKGGL
jgi:predicted Rdx family selenoprotein